MDGSSNEYAGRALFVNYEQQCVYNDAFVQQTSNSYRSPKKLSMDRNSFKK